MNTDFGHSLEVFERLLRVTLLRRSHSRRRAGFTLVEILVVTFILMLLAGIALPAVRDALKDGKKAQGAREVVAFLNEARARAIATGHDVGVVIPRFGSSNNYVRSVSNRMLLSNSVPPYTGESASALAILFHEPQPEANPSRVPNPEVTGPTNAAFFTADDSPLLFLSAANGGTGNSPIRKHDRLELQGGRSVVIRRMVQVAAANSSGLGAGAKVIFDPRGELFDERSAAATGSFRTVAFPSTVKITDRRRASRFRIHREPVASTVGSHSLQRGLAIDLNYSGVGDTGIQFSQQVIAPGVGPDDDIDCGNVAIVFGSDGSVSYMKHGVNSGGVPVFSHELPSGNIYLCLGTTDGVRPDNLLTVEDRATANVMNPETVWIVINSSTGFITASPTASVPESFSTFGTADVTDVREVVRRSRSFAVQADSLSTY